MTLGINKSECMIIFIMHSDFIFKPTDRINHLKKFAICEKTS